MELNKMQRRVWAEIDLNAVENNFNLIKEKARKDAEVICVIKANAYGHGAVTLAKFYERLGVKRFAVSNVEEALQLREQGINSDILILGYTDVECTNILIENNVTQCVYSLEYAKALSNEACKLGKDVNVHIKIDTGMGRIGFRCVDFNVNNQLEDAYYSCKLPRLQVKGIFTHFSVADEGEQGIDYTTKQYKNFVFAIDYLEKKGITFEVKHCSNSGAICDYSDFRLNAVRAGIALYGIQPSKSVKNKMPLIPVMTLKTVVSHLKTIRKGDSVNYGRTFIAKKEMKVATIPIGYADGFFRSNTGKVQLSIDGKKVDIVGRICMDQLVVDVTGIENLYIGKEVVVFGKEPSTTAEQIASVNNTIPYEVVCAVGMRVPRIYVYNEKIVSIQDYLI